MVISKDGRDTKVECLVGLSAVDQIDSLWSLADSKPGDAATHLGTHDKVPGSHGTDRGTYSQRGTKMTFLLHQRAHLPLAVDGAPGELMSSLKRHGCNGDDACWVGLNVPIGL